MWNNQDAKILIIDDNLKNLSFIVNYLKEYDFETITALSGQDGLEKAVTGHPDLILLDVMMPGIDGFETCRRLKANPVTVEIPVIFLTVRNETGDKLKGFAAGGVDYVTRPFDFQEMFARLNTHLTIRNLRQDIQEEKERFRGLSEAAFEGILIHEQGIIAEANPAMESLTGYNRAELLGKNGFDLLMPGEFRKIAEEHMYLKKEQPCEIMIRQKHGALIRSEVQGKNIRYYGRELMVIAIRDVSWRGELKSLEQKARHLESENVALRATLTERDRLGRLVGKTRAMQKVYERIICSAASDETVIIYGETGTGKELAARTIFELGSHYAKNFVAVNCGAVQEQLFESLFFGYCKGAFTGAEKDTPGFFGLAEGGTLFLDEVSELTLLMQAKLLRVLEQGEYIPIGSPKPRTADVRIISATNRRLRDLAREGRIREDFFHRMHVISLEMPPLRRRKEDIPLLTDHFMTQRFSEGDACPILPDDLRERFHGYDWPGNVRELFNELRRYLNTGVIELGGPLPASYPDSDDLPFLRESLPLSRAMAEFERFCVSRAMKTCQGKRGKAARALGIDRKTLYTKLKKYEE